MELVFWTPMLVFEAKEIKTGVPGEKPLDVENNNKHEPYYIHRRQTR